MTIEQFAHMADIIGVVLIIVLQNLASDADWRWNEWVTRNIGRRQAVRAAWAMFRPSYEKPFQDYIERQFAIADGVAPRA